MSIDLHCHTLFSIDSYGTPEELVDAAVERGISAIAITDHNSLGGITRGAERSRRKGIIFFPGVELDLFYGGRFYHFLGLGFDWTAPEITALVARNHRVYEHRFEIYYKILLKHGFPWSRKELEEHLHVRYPTHPDPVLNERVARHLVEGRGGLQNFSELDDMAAEQARSELDISRDRIGFCQYREAVEAVHKAGGVLLLAHPGKYFPEDCQSQKDLINRLLCEGMDGFEVYHPSNFDKGCGSELVKFAEQKNCLISGGSDCGHAKYPSPRYVGRPRFGEPTAPDSIIPKLKKHCCCFE